MKTSPARDILAEVWAIKDSLSAGHGHNLKATCRAIYAEQAKHPGDFVNLGAKTRQKALETASGARKSSAARKRRVRPARVSA